MHASVKGKTLIEVKTIEITISEKLPEEILVMCSWPQGTRLGDILLSRLSSRMWIVDVEICKCCSASLAW